MDRLYLNVFMLRQGAKAPNAVSLKGLNRYVDIPIGDGAATARLHYGLFKGVPDWFLSLAALSANAPKKLPETSSMSGVLTVTIGADTLLVTFGHGWQRVDRSMVEPNFGLRCVLNLAGSNRLKSIKRDRIADDFIQAIEQIPDADDIYRFDIDTDKDMLTGVKARVEESNNFGSQVSGTDSFKGSIDLANEPIGDYLSRCRSLYAQTSYKKKFGWVDNVLPVRDDVLATKLEEELAKLVMAKNPDISLCIPDLFAWDEYDLFTYETKKGKQSPVAYALSVDAWVNWTIGDRLKIDASALRNSSVYAYQQASKNLKKRWSVLQCLHGSIKYKKKTFLAHGGRWFELDHGFVAAVDAKIATLPISKLLLPNLLSLGETEGDYNARVAGASGGSICLLDKNNIMHGGGRSRIEVCDLLPKSGELVCVKPWGGGSASLSHLFQQAMVASRLISEDAVFNAKVRAKLPPSHHATWDGILAKGVSPNIVLAVLRGPQPSLLPFFARLSLSMCVTSLKQMRFNPSYLAIP